MGHMRKKLLRLIVMVPVGLIENWNCGMNVPAVVKRTVPCTAMRLLTPVPVAPTAIAVATSAVVCVGATCVLFAALDAMISYRILLTVAVPANKLLTTVLVAPAIRL